ncbi:hypothetical protein EI94DRAFT_1815428 [Lactarius quietus]|nr:hypothetical protein EI94DRAFT_1815428 [Lactarius quietus]
MAPQTRRPKPTVETASAVSSATVVPPSAVDPSATTSMVPAPNESAHAAKSNKGKKKKTHQIWCVVKQSPDKMRTYISIVTTGKRALSPGEGPSEQGSTIPVNHGSKKQKQKGPTRAYPPPLEVTDEEDAFTQSTSPGGSGTGGVQPSRGRKLKREETPLYFASSGTDNSLTCSESNSETFSSSEDEEYSKLSGFAQRVGVERPSWSTSAGDGEEEPSSASLPPTRLASPPRSHADEPPLDPEITGSTSGGSQATASDSSQAMTSDSSQATQGHQGHDDHPGHVVVWGMWPVDTDLCLSSSGKIKLLDQSQLV